MKILFYADTVFGFGGVQRVLAVMAQALARDHEVTILTTDRHADMTMYDYCRHPVRFSYISYDSPHDVQYLWCKALSFCYKKLLPKTSLTARLYSYSFFLPRYKQALVAAVNASGCDVVVGVHAFLSLHIASVRRRLKVPVAIGWMHNSYEALFSNHETYLPGLRDFFASEMRKIDRVVVLSHSDEALFRERLRLPAVAIYNPLTLQPRGRGSAAHKRFVAVGRFSPHHKGFDLLIRAFALFAPAHPGWTLEIVGEGDEEPLYRRLIAEAGLGERIILSPFTTDIQSHYAAASVYVLSSRWEGFGLVIVEAMAHGLPVVAADVPVARELLEGRGVAMLFRRGDVAAMADAMGRMAESPCIETMGERAADYARQFTVDGVCRQWLQLMGGGR